jgi:hypothetical protein
MAINLHVVRKCALTLRPEALSCEDSDWWSDAFIVEDAVVLLAADSGEARGRQTISAAELNEIGVGDELDQLIRTKWAAAMDGDIRPADRVSVKTAVVTRANIVAKIEFLQHTRATYLVDGYTVRTDTFLTNIREELDELDNLLQALDDQQRRESR